jgi:hypothetical protein
MHRPAHHDDPTAASPGSRWLRGGSARGLLLATYAALGLAWVFSDPPFTGPDEAAQYLRAVGISDGALIGAPGHGPPVSAVPLQQQAMASTSRAVIVPRGLSPDAYSCELLDPSISAACTENAPENVASVREFSYVGTYQPLPFLLPALVLRADGHAGGSLRLARLATLAIWLALLAVAIWMLWDESFGAPSLIGIILALTPMVVYLGASMSDSSTEIMASVAFFAALLRIGRDSEQGASRGVWTLAGVCGVVLALSRPLGPVWIALDLAISVALVGPRPAWALVHRAGRPAIATAIAVVVAIALNRYWEATYEPHVVFTPFPGLDVLNAGAQDLQSILGEFIGNFGYLNVPLSSTVEWLWALAVAVLLALAVGVGRSAARVAIAGSVLVAVAFPIYLFAASLRFTGFALQGRYTLPVAVVIPLVAAEALRRGRARLPAALPAALLSVVALIAAAVQLIAWWTNARRYAVGASGPTWFLGVAQWSPPVGWVAWATVAVVASLLLAFFWIEPRTGHGRRSVAVKWLRS